MTTEGEEILGMRFVEHFDDQEDEHIVIDLEGEHSMLQPASSLQH